jgi:hypothetical protein
MIGAVVIIIAIVAVFAYALMQGNERNAVEKAVNMNIEYYNTRNIDGYYDLVSQNSKDKYGVTLDDVANLLNKVQNEGRTITLVKISEVTIQGNTAVVKGVVKINDKQGSQEGQFLHTYVKENGEWKYEQTMTEPSETPGAAAVQ